MNLSDMTLFLPSIVCPAAMFLIRATAEEYAPLVVRDFTLEKNYKLIGKISRQNSLLKIYCFIEKLYIQPDRVV